MKDVLILIVVCLLVFGACIGALTAVDYMGCTAKADGLGYPHRYQWWNGCSIEVEPNMWVPMKNYYYEEE